MTASAFKSASIGMTRGQAMADSSQQQYSGYPQKGKGTQAGSITRSNMAKRQIFTHILQFALLMSIGFRLKRIDFDVVAGNGTNVCQRMTGR